MPRREPYEYKYRLPQKRHHVFRWLLIPVVLAVLVLLPVFQARRLEVDEHTVVISDMPTNMNNLHIVFLSDIHQGNSFSMSRVTSLFNKVNSLSPDIIILGGDYASDSAGALELFRNAPLLTARLGVFVVFGDCDRNGPESDLNLLLALTEGCGYTPLVNSVARMRVGSSSLYIAGSDDILNGYPDVSGLAAQVSSGDTVIFVAHSPDLMNDVLSARSSDGKNHWFDLALFGHTLGGQITVLGHTLFPELLPNRGSRYLGGWLEESRASVLVSPGVGTMNVPMRIGTTPQIHDITLKLK